MAIPTVDHAQLGGDDDGSSTTETSPVPARDQLWLMPELYSDAELTELLAEAGLGEIEIYTTTTGGSATSLGSSGGHAEMGVRR